MKGKSSFNFCFVTLLFLYFCISYSYCSFAKANTKIHKYEEEVIKYSTKEEKFSATLYTIEDQPRMYTSGGHLFFQTGPTYNISFKTVGSGRVNLNEMDLITLMNQVIANQADIDELQSTGGGTVPPDLINKVDDNTNTNALQQEQLNQHNSKLESLRADVDTLKSGVDTITSDLSANECSSNPCQHGGTCIDLYKSYLCQCVDQWQGPTCAQDVNECSQFATFGWGCQNGGTCVNSQGDFRCDCPSEYFGRFCTSKYDDCSDGSSKCQHGICVDAPREQDNVPKYTCVCEDGWKTASGSSDPSCSQDVDECAEKPCSKNPEVTCYNNPGSYTCGPCPSGFIGNGWACTDIDECATNNGGCSMSPLVSCINTPGSSTCGPCPAGYTGDGRVCTTQNPCSVNNGGCHPIATCSVNAAVGPSSVTCTCPNGYTGNGIGPNGCSLYPTDCPGTCQNGQCLDDGSGAQVCTCDPGWSGVLCDINIDECASFPCQNGGTCFDGINGFYCECPSNYGGTYCETSQSGCGAYYRQDSGAFSFPGDLSTGNYPNSASCGWVIEVSLGKVIQATFPTFNIQSSSNCANDFLQIHDGNSASAHLIGKYCGTTKPGDPLVSTHNLLYFWFYSDAGTNAPGFQVVWQTTDPVCGGDTTGATFGDITSPGYPGVYPSNSDCYWTIEVQPGNVVQLLFGTLALETHENCTFDFLEIRDGLLETDPLLARYCSSSSPQPLVSTSPGVWIHFHSDPYVTDTGFHIVWTSQHVSITGCGDYYTEDSGIIISPNWPNSYNLNQECYWQVHIGDYGQILLNFTHMDIEDHTACLYDYVEVRDGPDETSPLVARHCGNQLPPPYTSSTNDLWLKLKSDVSQAGSGFRATYTVACGGTYTDESGSFDSPYYPSLYPNDKNCYYLIRQTPGRVITLTFASFSVENHVDCAYDYIEVRDGSSQDSPLLARLCGNEVPVPIMSTHNYMWVHFATDFSLGGSGFLANYVSEYTGCGGVYTEPTGTLQSPGHPTPYPHGASCIYYISVDPSYIINFQFIAFSFEPPSTSNECYDFVEIFDGPNVNSSSIGRFCGSIIPPAIVSNGYTLTILFNADESINSEGFTAAYSTLNASTSCGKRLTENQGIVTSPNYPNNYYDARTCVWTLTVDPTMQIQVNFTDFKFESEDAEDVCIYDYLEIRNGGYDTSALIGTYCGNDSPGSFTTHGNQLYMKMFTDAYTNDKGFSMTYDGTLTGCGGTLTSADGYFQSPNYPYPYNHNSECFWLIKVSEGSTVRLTFSIFDIETHGYCEFDYVEIYDGPTTGYPLLDRQCGSRLPPPYESSDNTMLVKFRTDQYTGGSGFVAQYHVECTRTIAAKPYGYIQSLDFPKDYPPNRDCAWTVQGTVGNPINVTFTSFQMETCNDCSCDYVQIYDGTDIHNDPLLGKFCTSDNPGSFRTQSNTLLVVFHTDPFIQAPGFEILWAVDGCGDTLTEPTGVLTSPNYPNNYDDNRECIWQIMTSPGTSVELTITEFDVEHHQECDYDVLQIYNGLSVDTSYQLAILCNTDDNNPTLPMVVTSTSTFMTVRFLTDAFVNGRGFRATYKEIPGVCGGNLVTSSGFITSPNYPNNYASLQDCEWYIDVGEGNTVVITFQTFDIEPEPACEFDYVAIYDGNATTSPLLLKACGSSLPAPVQSTGHNVLFQFHSDPYFAHSGFKASFSSGCGGRFIVQQDGEITSPNYPEEYPPGTNCTWYIQSPEADGHVTLTFTHMDLYFNPSGNKVCGGDDYLEILDGSSLTSPRYSLYCNDVVPAPFTSFSNAFTITMVSQSLYQRSGFRTVYSTSTSRCGGELTAQSAYFNSPNYPDPYPVETQCVWTIRSAPGNGIHLQFLSFNLETHSSCLFDYVQVREGSINGPIIAQLCGAALPTNLTSVNGHVLYVIFRSDISTVGTGFQAVYQHVFGSTTMREFSGAIASPLYPSFYPNNLNVYYYVYAPVGRVISYYFTFFELEYYDGCQWDSVSIYDGDSTQSPLLLIACGDDFLPPPATTSQDALLLWFHSDWGTHERGFYMEWEAIEAGGIPPNPTNVPTIPPGTCGAEHLVAAVYPIYIVSPGWPAGYPNSRDCVWVIEAASEYRISATVVYIDTEASPTCLYDFIAFYNGPSTASPELGRFCGRTLPDSALFSSGNFLTIRFRTDSSVSYPGFNASYQQACGGVVYGDLGVIHSPNYPNPYPPSTTCEWQVVSVLGSTISITFDTQFEISNTNGAECSDGNGDYVTLLNGRNPDSPPLNPNDSDGNGRYCGTSSPADLQTDANGLFVRFQSDEVSSGAGFKFTFTSRDGSCGSRLLLTDDVTSATFTSPNYPSAYPDGIECYWLISVPVSEAVQVDFTTFQLENHQSCDYDYVELIDGHTGEGQVLGKFCGTSLPPTVKSFTNEMVVKFRSDPYTNSIGFEATYSIAACGGTLVGLAETITSPNYPQNYPTSTSCQWIIRGPAYHYIIFTFDAINLDVSDSQSCGDGTGDYVEIRSYNFTGPILDTICGSSAPDSLQTVDNIAYVTFFSDDNGVSSGFSMSYQISEDECGGDLNSAGGTIMSPNYPNAYDHARVCTWNIVVPEDRSVTLVFNVFAIEDPYEDGVCYWDYAEVFDGITDDSPSMSGRFCGSITPPSYQSSGNTMRVIFATDASVSNGGFLATYDSYQARQCGGRLNLPEGGSFTSPNYPGYYNDSTECTWTIENPNRVNSTIYITFDAFALENHIVCDWDFLSFRTGTNVDGYHVNTLCGRTIPQPFGIAFSEAFVQFVSDPYVNDAGFKANYRFMKCGGFIGGTTNGVITSPNYPDVYDHSDYCLWTIAVEEGHKINLRWTDFAIEEHNSCQYDYLKIFNGQTTDSPLVDTYCGTNAPTEFQSGSNAVTILFQSDFSVSQGGWRVEWSADNSGCGNIIYHDHTGTVTSPGYPSNYPTNIDCIWQIVVDPAYHVDILFDQDFFIEPHTSCFYDYVAVLDGASESSEQIGQYCGVSGSDSAPPDEPVSSSMQAMTVRFRSDFSSTHKGFSANWEAQCGQTLTAETGKIQTPNYPSAYNDAEYCEFLITFESQYKFIKLTFNSFSVEAGSQPDICDYDYVKVYGAPSGSDNNRRVLGTFCGNLRPTDSLSSEGSMLVVFSTDVATFDYGFQATYESSDCGGMLLDSTGSINAFTHSDVHNNRNCTWQINVPETENIIELKFSTFDLEAHTGCLYDNVKVYDGIDTSAPLIGTYCGNRVPDYIHSTGNTMTIEYVTDDLVTGNGFTAGYRSMIGPQQGCGGTLTESSGEFSSIDLDNSGYYDSNLNCLWLIQTDVNTVINLTFSGFILEGESSPGYCGYDFIRIRDGLTSLDPIVMTACGSTLPSPYISTGNGLFVRFVSDPIIQDVGFNATYQTLPQTCGGSYSAVDSFTTLTSPIIDGYNQAYNCRWTIDAGLDTTKYLEIQFDSLDIQSSSNPPDGCSAAYLELRDFPLGDFGQVYQYCGSETPVNFFSLGQIVQVNFRTEAASTGAGFQFRYKTIGCSRTLTQNQGQVFSPGWPDPYPHNAQCETSIQVASGNYIQLFFNFFDIEFENDCNFDHLEIRNGTDASSDLIATLCGNSLPDPIFVQSDSVFLKLVIDPYITARGHDITYTSSSSGCGGNITGDHGSVYSLMYPQPYPPNLDCMFSIRTPLGRPVTIHITFVDIYYECDNGCRCIDDLMYVYGGPTISSPLIGAYCGYGTLNDLQSPTNAAVIRFVTTDFSPGSRTNAGFRVDFES